MNHRTIKIMLCLWVACANTALAGSVANPVVKIAQGELEGSDLGAVDAFLGVPFAAAPVGELRWKAPRPPLPWQDIRDATALAPSCQQELVPGGFGPWTPEYLVDGEVSEDCLYLNIWAPEDVPDGRAPVLVWIHGGGFVQGSGSVPIYNGEALAENGLLVVTVNYRLGVYGFLAHPDLTAEGDGASGNYGLMDQIAALEWVKENIAAFGGDPDRVTIAGQSAGAASVHHLIASPLASNLFSQAIAESGSGMGLSALPLADAEKAGVSLLDHAGIEGIEGLRALDTQALDNAVAAWQPGQSGFRFFPIVDGKIIPDAGFLDANTNDTPVLTGMTANEGTGLNPNYGKMTVASYRDQINGVYGSLAEEVLTLYPASTDSEASSAYDSLMRDRGLASMYFWAEKRFTQSDQPVYAYLFSHVEPGPDSERYKAFHSSEIPYVFGTLDTSQRPFTPLDHEISAWLRSYWTTFVETGAPQGDEPVAWPRLRTDEKLIAELDEDPSVRPILTPEKLDLFRRYVAQGGKLGLF